MADLVDIPMGIQESAYPESFVDHMKEVHDQVRRQLGKSNTFYKMRSKSKRRIQLFAEGGLVYTHTRKD